MANLIRFTQKPFASGAGTNQLSVFGSLAAAAPARYSGSTITPTLIQSLTNYTNGLFDAIVGGGSPAIEDINSLFYLSMYQLSYLLQLGIPEWDAGTTYETGCFVTMPSDNSKTALYCSTGLSTNQPPYPSGGAAWGSFAVADQFTVGDKAKTGNNVFLIKNSGTNPTDGGQLWFLIGPGSTYQQTFTADGSVVNQYFGTAFASASYKLQTNVAGGSMTDVMNISSNTGIANFPFGINVAGLPLNYFSGIKQLVYSTASPGTGTYTPSSADVKYIIVEVIGGGGSGGSTTVSGTVANAGGGSGAWSRGIFARASFGATVAYTVGAGGINPGNTLSSFSGSSSSFGTLITSVGGGSGASGADYGVGAIQSGSVAPVGDSLINNYGSYGAYPSVVRWTSAVDFTYAGGFGGINPYGTAGIGVLITGANQVGVGGTGFGAGGAGGSGQGAGGRGASGAVIITEIS